MEYTAATRHAAATDLHLAAQVCLAKLRRSESRLPEADGEGGKSLSLGIELHTSAPAIVVLAKGPRDQWPEQVERIEVAAFTADEVRLASVAAAVVTMLLQDADAEMRQQVAKLVRSGNGYLSLYVIPEPFAAALSLFAGGEILELGRIASEPPQVTLQ